MRLLIIIIFILLLIACKQPSPKLTIIPPSQPLRGETSFKILTDPNAPKQQLQENQFYQRPKAKGELAIPIYPQQALDSKTGEVSVAVRIVIDEEGKVSKITESPVIASTPSIYLKDFQQAVEAAMQKWVFEAAEIQQFEDGKDLDGDGKPDYKRLISSEKIAVYLDLRFDFTIVAGRGQVSTTSPPNKP